MLEFFTPNLVLYIVYVCLVIIVTLNFILNYNDIKNDTINNILVQWANGRYFYISFLFGVLGGHFFLGSENPLFKENWWLPVVLIILLSALLLCIGKRKPKGFKIKRRYQILLIITGLAYGHFVWSQRHEQKVFSSETSTNLPKYCTQ